MTTPTGARRVLVILLTTAAVLALPAGATAEQGVSINLGAVAVRDHLAPGGSYDLPTMRVSNPGDETTTYRMASHSITGQVETALPTGWLEMQPARFTVEPGDSQEVALRLVIPEDATTGDYLSLVAAEAETSGSGGAMVGAAAAARLSFTVAPLHEPWPMALVGFIARNLLVVLVSGGLVVLSMAVIWFRRRFTLEVTRRA